jgi:outer membrane protein assembly factor BamB
MAFSPLSCTSVSDLDQFLRERCRIMSRLLFTVVVAGTLTVAATAADWPQWRGPDRNGISKETGLLAMWPKDGPRLVWQIKDIGYGYTTPAVVGPRLYLVSSKGNDNEFVQAREVKDGAEVWTRKLGKVGNLNQKPPYPGARSTPTVDGDVLFVLGSDGDLACVEIANGKVRWHKNLRTDFDGKPGTWAYSESPLIDGDVLVCTPGGKDATLVALDKKTGSVIWKSAVPGGDAAGYASVTISHAAGRKQYVQFLAKGVVGVDAKTGAFLWRYDKTAKNSPANIPTPVVHADFVYSGTGLGGGGLVRLKAEGGGIIAEPVYYERDVPTSIGGAIVLGEYLYGTNGQGLLCAELATGKQQWQDMCVGAASLCYAEGRLYVHGENGDVALVEASPKAYRELGRFTPPDQPKHLRGTGEKAWSYPVVANGRLYIHDVGTLWCYDVKDSKGSK